MSKTSHVLTRRRTQESWPSLRDTITRVPGWAAAASTAGATTTTGSWGRATRRTGLRRQGWSSWPVQNFVNFAHNFSSSFDSSKTMFICYQIAAIFTGQFGWPLFLSKKTTDSNDFETSKSLNLSTMESHSWISAVVYIDCRCHRSRTRIGSSSSAKLVCDAISTFQSFCHLSPVQCKGCVWYIVCYNVNTRRAPCTQESWPSLRLREPTTRVPCFSAAASTVGAATTWGSWERAMPWAGASQLEWRDFGQVTNVIMHDICISIHFIYMCECELAFYFPIVSACVFSCSFQQRSSCLGWVWVHSRVLFVRWCMALLRSGKA